MITLDVLIKHINDIIEYYPSTLEVWNDKDGLKLKFDYGLLYEKWCKFLNKDYSFNITTIDLISNRNYQDNLKMILKAKKFLREVYDKN